jgi:hypothetical protein
MGVLITIFATFVLCGALVTLIVSRFLRVELSVVRFLGAFLVAALLGVAVASMIIWALVRGEYGGFGFMEGGLVIAMIWLVCYSITYLVSAVVVARIQSRGPAHARRNA